MFWLQDCINLDIFFPEGIDLWILCVRNVECKICYILLHLLQLSYKVLFSRYVVGCGLYRPVYY